MVPDIVPPPPPPPMPSANYVPPKPALTIVRSEKLPSPPRNPSVPSGGDSFDSVINEIKNKGGTLRKTKRKEVVPLEECIIPTVHSLKSAVITVKPTFKNEIIVNIVPTTTNAVNRKSSSCTDVTDKGNTAKLTNGTEFKLKRPSEFLNGQKPELQSVKKEVRPQLAPKLFVNGTKQDSKSKTNGTTTSLSNGISTSKKTLTNQPPQRKLSLVSSTIQRLTSNEPDSPTETPTSPFKRNQLRRSTSGGINSTIEKLERQNSATNSTTLSFQRSNSVRQKIQQMNQVEHKQTIKDGTQTVGRRPTVPRPNLPRPSTGTIKFLTELHNPSIARVPVQNGNAYHIRLENEEANVGTTINVPDGNGTVTAGDPNVKKLVYNTYRNFLGAYNNKANVVVTNQNGTMVVQDRGVAEQLEKISQHGKINNLTGRAIQKNDD